MATNQSSIPSQGPILNLAVPSPEIIGAMNRVYNLIILSCEFVALSLFLNLLFFAQFCGQKALGSKCPQPTMRLFLLFHSIGILTSIPATIYKLFIIVDPAKYLDLLFWLYALNCNYNLSISPFFVLFLTVERLMAIRFPIAFKNYRQKFVWMAAALSIFFYLLSFAFFLAELPLDPKISLSSPPLVRIAPKFNFQPQSIIKTAFGICNVFCCISFLFLLNRAMGRKIKNRVVKFTVICEIIFNISTGIANLLSTTLTGRTLSMYVGVLDNALMNMDSAVCAIFYSWIFLWAAKIEEKVILAGTKSCQIQVQQRPMPIQNSISAQ